MLAFPLLVLHGAIAITEDAQDVVSLVVVGGTVAAFIAIAMLVRTEGGGALGSTPAPRPNNRDYGGYIVAFPDHTLLHRLEHNLMKPNMTVALAIKAAIAPTGEQAEWIFSSRRMPT